MTTIYVAWDGNDITGNGTASNPYLTLAVAQTAASPGYTIQIIPKKVGSGDPNQALIETVPFHIVKNNLTIQGNSTSASVIQFTGLVTTAAIYIEADNVIFRNLSLYADTPILVKCDTGSDGTTNPAGHMPTGFTMTTCVCTYKTFALQFIWSNVLIIRNVNFITQQYDFNVPINLCRCNVYTEISNCTNSGLYRGWEFVYFTSAIVTGSTYEYILSQLSGQMIVKNNTLNLHYGALYLETSASLFTPNTNNLLYLNICGNNFSGTTFLYEDLSNPGSKLLALFGLIAMYSNTSTNAYFQGCFYIAGNYGGTLPITCKTIFDSNVIPSNAGTVSNYNNEPLITTSSLYQVVSFSNQANYIKTTWNTPYAYFDDPKQFETILPYLVIGTYFRNSYTAVLLCKGTVTVTMNNVTLTVTNPSALDSFFIGVYQASGINGLSPIFGFYINEYDQTNTLMTVVSQNIQFNFTTNISNKLYEFYLYSYNDYINNYVNTWNILSKVTDTLYTTTLIKNMAFVVSELSGLSVDFSNRNIVGNSMTIGDVSIQNTVGTKNLVINNTDGLTDLYKTRINDSTAINMDVNTNYSLAVDGTAFLSTGTTWTTSSDKRIKQNIEKIDTKQILDLVSNMNVYSYEYDKRYVDDNGKKRVGLIAQDLEKIEPKEYVSMIKDYGKLTLDMDTIENFKTVDYSNLLFYLLVTTKYLLEKKDE